VTTTAVSEIYARALRRIGARTGTLGTVTVGGSTTTAVLNGLVNTTGDPEGFPVGDRLIFPASAAGSQEMLVTTWADSTGLATFTNLAVAPTEGDAYWAVNREDYTQNELDYAWAETLRETRRTYRQVIPITPNLDLYPLTQCDWLRGDGDIDAAWISQSPIWLHNEDFSLWQLGSSAVPDGYSIEGTAPVIARSTGGLRSPYACTVTAGVDTARLVQQIPYSLSQWLTRRTAAVFTPIRASTWLTTTDANSVRLFIRYTETSSGSPVTTYTYSSYATADGNPEFLYCSLTPTATMGGFTWGIEVLTTKSFTASTSVLMQNTTDSPSQYSIRDMGSQTYIEMPLNMAVRNVGGVPTIELTQPIQVLMQLIVYVRRPMPQLVAYTDPIEDQYVRGLEWGLLAWLTRTSKPGQDRSRLDPIMVDSQREWARFVANLRDAPVPKPPVRQEVWSA